MYSTKNKEEELSREITIKLSKPLKDLDAKIDKIIRQDKDDGTIDYYALEFSFLVSMGERGFLRTIYFDELPDVSEIRNICINEIKVFIEIKDNFWANYYEEQAVVKLKKILKKWASAT